MNFVIQTDLPYESVLDIAEASRYLKQVHAVEEVSPLVLEESTYHYLKIDDDADLDWLVPRLLELPSIKAAYSKPADDLPGF
jgi:hypothetical protein